MIRGLYIGRFQPYHNGHDKMMSIISSNVDEVIIGIGSSQESYTLYNPFTYEERLRMIQDSTNKYSNIKYIIPYEDVLYDFQWVPYILSKSPKFDFVYSNNPIVSTLFSKYNIKVKSTTLYDRIELSGTNIRRLISINDDYWIKLVPLNVSNIISSIDGIKRIQSLFNK